MRKHKDCSTNGKNVHYHRTTEENEICGETKSRRKHKIRISSPVGRADSQASIYFTPTSTKELSKTSKNRHRLRKKIDVNIHCKKHLESNDHVNNLDKRDVIRRSNSTSSDGEDFINNHQIKKETRKYIHHNHDGSCECNGKVQDDNNKKEIFGRKNVRISIRSRSPKSKNNNHDSCQRRSLYNKPKTKDRSEQTELICTSHKECQVSSFAKTNKKTIDIQTEIVCKMEKECQTEKIHEDDNDKSCPIFSTDEYLQTDRDDEENCYKNGRHHHWSAHHHHQIHRRTRAHGHVFPFVGESPSGNLKVPKHMVVYENANLGILLEDPTKTRLQHQEWQDNDCGGEPIPPAPIKICQCDKGQQHHHQEWKNDNNFKPERNVEPHFHTFMMNKLLQSDKKEPTPTPTNSDSSTSPRIRNNIKNKNFEEKALYKDLVKKDSNNRMISEQNSTKSFEQLDEGLEDDVDEEEDDEYDEKRNKKADDDYLSESERYLLSPAPSYNTDASSLNLEPHHPSTAAATTSKSVENIPSVGPYLDTQALKLPREGLLVLGGSDPTQPISNIPSTNTGKEIFMYLINSMTWTSVGAMPEPRTHFGIAKMGYEVYIIGGTDPRYKTSNERYTAVKSVWLVNLKNGEWYFDSEHPLDLENPRSHFGCAAKDGSIYIFGGNDAEAKALSTCQKFDVILNAWTPIVSMDGPRVSMGVAVYQDNIWLAGGISKNPQTPVLKSVICYDTITNGWTTATSLPLPRAFSTLVVAHGKLYILGGAGPKNNTIKKPSSVSQVFFLDQDEGWKEVGPLNIARHGHSAVAIDHQIVVLGGVTSEQITGPTPINSVEMYDISTSSSKKGRGLYEKLSGMGAVSLIGSKSSTTFSNTSFVQQEQE